MALLQNNMSAQNSKSKLSYNNTWMRSTLSASQKINPSEIFDARKTLIKLIDSDEQGWMSITDNKTHLAEINKAYEKFKNFKNCLVIGIGGSDLGARAIIEALRKQDSKIKIWFTGDTTDPDEIESIFSQIPWKQTCINIISKSGGTLEPMASFFLAKERLEKAVGVKKAVKAILCTTDPEKGALLEFARENNYATLSIPQNIGGRFSVLTAVGLFPLKMAGIDITKLRLGASQMRDSWLKHFGTSHAIDQFAAWHVSHGRSNRPMHVLMIYSKALHGMGMWWRQLWAESLGKSSAAGGPTPIIFLGPTDQHSQLQLYQDGPDDKVYTFLEIEKFNQKIKVPNSIKNIPSLNYALKHDFSDLIHSAAQGTAIALKDKNKPVGIINIKNINENSLGELIMFLQIATAVAGNLYCINPFNQPGVEDSKNRVKELLTNN